LGTLVLHAPTLRQAIALISQFHPLVMEAVRVELVERMGVARLRCELVPGNAVLDHSFVEMVVAGLVRMLKAFGCAHRDIRAVCFEYPPPAHCSAYAAAFGGTERFSQPFTGVEFSAHALDRRHVHHDLELHTLILAQAERTLDRGPRPMRCVDRVRVILSSAPVAQLPEMVELSRKLGLSERTLRRKLEDEGTSYRELTQSIQYKAACAMLRDPDLTLQSIAHALGFADSTAFHRAFLRWAKFTPAEYRASLVASGAPRGPRSRR
jgi:AraC-like DNA-binding protein